MKSIVIILVAGVLLAEFLTAAFPANAEHAFDIETIKLEVREVPVDASLAAFDFASARKGKGDTETAASEAGASVADKMGTEEKKEEKTDKMEEKPEEKMTEEKKDDENKDSPPKPESAFAAASPALIDAPRFCSKNQMRDPNGKCRPII